MEKYLISFGGKIVKSNKLGGGGGRRGRGGNMGDNGGGTVYCT